MVEVPKASFVSRLRSTLGRWLRRLFAALVIAFAAIGFLAATFQAVSWISDGRWTIAEFQRLVAEEETKRLLAPFWDLVGYLWDNGSRLTQNVSFLLIAVAIFFAVMRIKLVARIMSDFLVARGPIYNLQSTIIKVEETVQRLSDLQPTFELVNEKVDALQKQLADLQRYTSSERTDPGGGPPEDSASVPAGRPSDDDAGNWEKLRELWYANAARIEGVIERIQDRRRKIRYDRMPRTNYTSIIKALARDGFISEAAEKASIDLNATFLRYRPRNRKIPDDAIGALEVLDKLLEKEIGNAPPVDEQ